MPGYRDTFKLDIDDIDLIEDALREHARVPQTGDAEARNERARAVQGVLGKLHAQKIFFSQSARRRVPNG